MIEKYHLEKWIWDQDDFETMGWHDNPIYAMSFEDDVMFDLDYLFKWVQPLLPRTNYWFWISPATLLFKQPTRLEIDIELDFVNGIEINMITKEVVNGKTNYIIEAQEGRIRIQTEEFTQIIRRPPTLQITQCLPILERGQICFDLQSEKGFVASKPALTGRKLSYEFAKLRNVKSDLQLQLDDFDDTALRPKERIIKRRHLKEEIRKVKNKLIEIDSEMSKIFG